MTEESATRASQAPHGPHTPPGGPGPHPAPADASQGRTALRDQIAEALYRQTMDQVAGRGARLLTRGETALWENSLARADAVLPVVEAETAALRQRAEEAEELLRELLDIRPCDMRGRWCQAHLEKAPCPQGEAQRYLAALDQPEETR